MKRNLPPEYGVDGEFYVDGDQHGTNDPTVVDVNRPPTTQPSLWCDWTPTDDGTAIEWNGMENFYEYVPWIKYLIEKILAPRGYALNGTVRWQGEEFGDIGSILIEENVVHIRGFESGNASLPTHKMIHSIVSMFDDLGP